MIPLCIYRFNLFYAKKCNHLMKGVSKSKEMQKMMAGAISAVLIGSTNAQTTCTICNGGGVIEGGTNLKACIGQDGTVYGNDLGFVDGIEDEQGVGRRSECLQISPEPQWFKFQCSGLAETLSPYFECDEVRAMAIRGECCSDLLATDAPVVSPTNPPTSDPTPSPTSPPTTSPTVVLGFTFDAPDRVFVETADCVLDTSVSWLFPGNYEGNENHLWGFKVQLCDRSEDFCAYRNYPIDDVWSGDGSDFPYAILCADEITNMPNPAAPDKEFPTPNQYWSGDQLHDGLDCYPQYGGVCTLKVSAISQDGTEGSYSEGRMRWTEFNCDDFDFDQCCPGSSLYDASRQLCDGYDNGVCPVVFEPPKLYGARAKDICGWGYDGSAPTATPTFSSMLPDPECFCNGRNRLRCEVINDAGD